MKINLFLILGMFSMACDPHFNEIPNQHIAEAIVWNECYGEEGVPPSIDWLFQDQLNCGGYGGPGVGFISDNECLLGLYSSPPNDWIQLAWPDKMDKISESAFSHELMHSHLQRLKGDADGTHSSLEWQSGGLLSTANMTLANRGF